MKKPNWLKTGKGRKKLEEQKRQQEEVMDRLRREVIRVVDTYGSCAPFVISFINHNRHLLRDIPNLPLFVMQQLSRGIERE